MGVDVAVTYTIGTLSSLSGISQHTIRAWERRYQALSPGRSDTNRRIYLQEDLDRLSLLRQIVESGHSIGQVAPLPTDQLRSLVESRAPRPQAVELASTGTQDSFLVACRDAIEKLDPERLEECLVRAGAALGVTRLLDEVVIPLLASIDTGWSDGTVSISQEHMATAALRSYLDQVRLSMPGNANAPRIIVTTPRDQHHEIGALIVAIVAAMESWRVTYLGPNLPMRDIADSVRKSGARAVALSLVYPDDDPKLDSELLALRENLGPSTALLVGGRAADYYRVALAKAGAVVCHDLETFRVSLSEIALVG